MHRTLAKLNGVLEGLPVRGGEEQLWLHPLESEGSIEVHAPVRHGPWFIVFGRWACGFFRLLNVGDQRPFGDEVG